VTKVTIRKPLRRIAQHRACRAALIERHSSVASGAV
jgi:hypothetical protein